MGVTGTGLDLPIEIFNIPSVMRKTAVHLVARKSPASFQFFGMNAGDISQPSGKPFDTVLPLDAAEIDVDFMDELESISYIGTDAQSQAELTPNVNKTRFKTGRVQVTVMHKHYDLDVFEKRFTNAKTHPDKVRYANQKGDAMVQDWAREFGTAMWANTPQTYGSTGGFRWWLKATGTLFIGTHSFDLAAAANASLRAQVNSTAGNPDRDRFRALMLAADEKGGNVRTWFLDRLSFDFFYGDLEASGANTVIQKDNEWLKFPGRKVEYFGATFLMDGDAPSGYGVGLTPESWGCGVDKSGIQATDWKRLENYAALWRTHQDSLAAVVCNNPQQNCISSAHTYV